MQRRQSTIVIYIYPQYNFITDQKIVKWPQL